MIKIAGLKPVSNEHAPHDMEHAPLQKDADSMPGLPVSDANPLDTLCTANSSVPLRELVVLASPSPLAKIPDLEIPNNHAVEASQNIAIANTLRETFEAGILDGLLAPFKRLYSDPLAAGTGILVGTALIGAAILMGVSTPLIVSLSICYGIAKFTQAVQYLREEPGSPASQRAGVAALTEGAIAFFLPTQTLSSIFNLLNMYTSVGCALPDLLKRFHAQDKSSDPSDTNQLQRIA